MNSNEARRARAHWLCMLKELTPNYFLTFNFGYAVRSIDADKPMRAFFCALQREAFGRDWASQFSRDWPVAVGFLEHPDTNPHYHVLARISAELASVLESDGQRLWKRIRRRGQLHIEEIRNPDRVHSYCTKRLATRQRFDDVFVFSDTRGK